VSEHSTSSGFRCAIVVALLVFIGTTITLGLRQPAPPAAWDAEAGSQAPHRSAKPVYRYSVVRGGVHSRTDVIREMRRDPVVETHYAGIAVDRLRAVVLQEESIRYVSFRKDDRVYWTRRPVSVPRGEALLSAGQTEIRARCGNRLAVTPQSPTLPPGVIEPSESQLAAVESLPEDSELANAVAAESAAIFPPRQPDQAPPGLAFRPFTPVEEWAISSEQDVFGQGRLGLSAPGLQRWSEAIVQTRVVPPEALCAGAQEFLPGEEITTAVSLPFIVAGAKPYAEQGKFAAGRGNERVSEVCELTMPAPEPEPDGPVLPSVPVPEPKTALLLFTIFTVFAGWRLITRL
jgi:hypothetical protein